MLIKEGVEMSPEDPRLKKKAEEEKKIKEGKQTAPLQEQREIKDNKSGEQDE